MVLICRAEDGEVFQVSAGLADIERHGNLENFLYQETGVDPEAILAFLSDGRRLKTDNIRELAGARDETIYVFNKDFLDLDQDEVLDKLRIQAPLQPSIDDTNTATPPIRPSQLATSYLSAAHFHLRDVKRLVHSLGYQHSALSLSLGSLELRVLQISDAFEEFSIGAKRELEKQAGLLTGLDADLEIVGRVRIHPEFMSLAVQRAIRAGEKGRTLGDYVSIVKMHQVADTCARTHGDLESRFVQVREAMQRLLDGTNGVRAVINDSRLLDDTQMCANRCQETYERMTDAAGTLESPAADPSRLLAELRQLDASLRSDLTFMTDAKNTYTERLIDSLRQISILNDDVVRIPAALTSLQANFKVKNSFSHIQRLHNMLYAYGATVVEIVRRKEFSRFFLQRAQSILEIMAKLSAAERKRRQVYRGEIHGQLPFDTKGMDDPVPSIDFSPSGTAESPYSLERSDVEEFLQLFNELEQFTKSSDPGAYESLCQTRSALEKAVAKIDGLEAGFDRIAERSLLSTSRLSSSRRRIGEADDRVFQDLSSQLNELQQSKVDQDCKHKQEVEALRVELTRLKSTVSAVESAANDERARADKLEVDLYHARAQLDNDSTARRILEDRNKELVYDLERQQHNLSVALAEATDKTKSVEIARQELAQVCAEFEDVKALESANAAKIGSLLRDQAMTLRNLEEARSRGEDLFSQIESARNESERVNRALDDASKEKDRLLRAQASEHDRIMRDHIAEADGDRAVLEHQFSEMQATLQERDRQLKDLRTECDVAHADAAGLREEQQRVERDLREARHAERVLRADLKVGRSSQSDYEQQLEQSARLVAQILDVALAFRHSHVKALSLAQAMVSHPGAVSKTPPNLNDSVFSNGLSFPGARRGLAAAVDEPSPIDPSDPVAALELLRAYDQDLFLEAISKTGSTIRKWQKQCKEYRERAKGKISFRNFAKGDLALFLPTRNSVSKPWAAFNVSFPHYFLQATGHLAEQLKTREWIVARITSITERMVNHKDPSSNPYGLGDGIKYYMLEVEDWTQPAPTKRRGSSRKVSADKEALLALTPATVPLPPGPPEAEDEESFGTTRPPTSHLFPVRARAGSSPPARPSALSKLLAQAAPGGSPLEPIRSSPGSRSSSPPPASSSPAQAPVHVPELTTAPPSENASSPTTPKAPTSPVRPSLTPSSSKIGLNAGGTGALGLSSGPAAHAPNLPSPLRPGSRASRLSFSSRFPATRPPFPGSVASSGATTAKASPTTALSDLPSITDPFMESPPLEGAASPSPEDSISEDMSKVLMNRRRTTSYHVPRTSPLAANSTVATPTRADSVTAAARPTATSALAILASSWGVSFSRRRKAEMALPLPTAASPPALSSANAGDTSEPSSEAQDVPGAFASPGITNDRRGSGRGRAPSAASEILKRF